MYSLDVSIILVNYNTTSLLLQAIKSVYEKSSGFSFEIIVVDNNSTEKPQNKLIEYFGDKIIYLQLSENIGFGRANNEGIKIAKGRNLFLLNTDTYLINNAIFILMDYIDRNPKVGSCGGTLLTPDLKPTYSYHRISFGIWSYEIPQLTLGLTYRLVRHKFFNTTDKPLSVGNISGANFMVRHDVIKKVGSFNPVFFMYCEETELSWRIRKAGYKNINVPQAKIVHLEGGSSELIESRKMMEFDGRKKYYLLTRGKLYFYIANIILLASINLRIFLYKILKRRRKEDEYKLLKKVFCKAYC
jgi:GT2 family glycosyltransferase